MTRHATIICIVTFLSACGAPQQRAISPLGSNKYPPEVLEEKAAAALESGQYEEAKTLWTMALKNPDSVWANRARLGLAKLTATQDSGTAADQFRKLLKRDDLGALAPQVTFFAGIISALARRCITAIPLLEESFARENEPRKSEAASALVQCHFGLSQLPFVDHVLTNGDEQQQGIARTRLSKSVREMEESLLRRATELAQATETKVIVLAERGRRAISRDDRGELREISPLLPSKNPVAQRIQKILIRPRIGVLLPLSGPSAAFGTSLKSGIEALRASAQEDGLDALPELVFIDIGRRENVVEGFKRLQKKGSVFAAVGVFDRSVARDAADIAYAAKIPLLMLTTSESALRHEGRVWRGLHSPQLTVRVAVGAGLARNGRRALVLTDKTEYSREHAKWFERIWRAAGGTLRETIEWNGEGTELERVAKQVESVDFDTLFLPTKPETAAQLLRHLARVGIWASPRPKPLDPDEGVRSVLVIGTPEWYGRELHLLGGRYGRFALVPTPFALETARGATFGKLMQARAQRLPTLFDALLADGIAALTSAYDPTVDWANRSEKVGQIGYKDGLSPGFDFRRGDALPSLFLMEVTDEGFQVARDTAPENRFDND